MKNKPGNIYLTLNFLFGFSIFICYGYFKSFNFSKDRISIIDYFDILNVELYDKLY
jgi:hypothetical protein